MVVQPPARQRVMLSALIAGVMAGQKCKLFQNELVCTPNTLLTDFVEADFTGYAPTDITWGTVGTSGGLAIVTSDLQSFAPTDSVSPNTIYGYYVTNTAGSTLCFSENFDPPLDASTLGNLIEFIIKWGQVVPPVGADVVAP